MSNKITLGYWDIRGLATPIRMMLEYVGADYQDKLYKCGPPPNYDRTEWLQDKFNMGIDFPNLPYIIDGSVKISQSEVIMRYLARKYNLHGKTEADQLKAEVLAAQVRDYIVDYGRICYNPQFNQLKVDYAKALPDKLKALSDFLGSNKFVCGDYVTYADFVLFEFLEAQSYFDKEVLKNSPVLQEFHKRFMALEAIDKYWKSDRAIKFPFNGSSAYYGGAYSAELNKSA